MSLFRKTSLEWCGTSYKEVSLVCYEIILGSRKVAFNSVRTHKVTGTVFTMASSLLVLARRWLARCWSSPRFPRRALLGLEQAQDCGSCTLSSCCRLRRLFSGRFRWQLSPAVVFLCSYLSAPPLTLLDEGHSWSPSSQSRSIGQRGVSKRGKRWC